MHRKRILALLLASTLMVTSVGMMPVAAAETSGSAGTQTATTQLGLTINAPEPGQGNSSTNATGQTSLTLVLKDHQWIFTAKDNVVSVSCDKDKGDNCGYEGSVTVEAADAAYTGAAYTGAKVTVTENFKEKTGAKVGDITYYKAAEAGSTGTAGEALTEAPKEAGNYVAVCTVIPKGGDAVTAKKAFSISYQEIQGEGFTFNPETGKLAISSNDGFENFKNTDFYRNDSSRLTDVEITGTVTVIPDAAFSKCSSLKTVFIENGVTSIGSEAFVACDSLTEVIIPGSVTSIGSYAFSACTSLATVKAEGATPPTIGKDVFSNTRFVTDNKEGQGIKVRMSAVDSYKSRWAAWAKYIAGYELHTHNFVYSVKDNVITLSCTNENEHDECFVYHGDNHVLTCTLNAENAEYDGLAHKATVTDQISGELGLEAPVITYYQGNTQLETAPVAAGTYEARVTIKGQTAVKTFTIAQKKAELEWTGSSEFTYNGADHEITAKVVNGVEGDGFSLTYENNKAAKAGSYTAKVTGLGNDNYTLDGVENVTKDWSIQYLTVDKDSLPQLTGSKNENGWYTGNVTLNPKEGYKISKDGKTWENTLTLDKDGTYGVDYYLKDASGNISDKQTISVKKDATAPTGEITIGTNTFKDLLNQVTFGHFFKDKTDVKITSSDAASGIAKTEYQIVKKGETYQPDGNWTEVKNGGFSIEAPQTCVIYVRMTDAAGNTKVVSSEGIVVYTDATASDSVTYERLSDQDVTSAIAFNGNTVKAVKNGDTVLTEGTDYEVKDGKLVLKADYMQTLAAGTHNLTVSYNPNGEAFTDASTGTAAKDSTITVTVARASADRAETKITNTDKLSKTYDGSVAEKPEASSKNGSTPVVEYKKKGASDDTYTTAEPKDAGTYVVRVTYPADADYDQTSATAEFTIAQVPVTVTVSDATKHIGKADPAFSYEITDGALVGEDTLGDVSFTRAEGEAAGTYAITAAKNANTNANYDITFVDGTLTITDHVKAETPVKENEKAPTCTEAGSYDEVYYCTVDDCGAELERTTKTVDALGHNYGKPVFTWKDHNTASAAFTCANDTSHVETADAAVTSETTKAATCEEAGTLTYTATVKFGDKTYTDTKTEEIPATGHAYADPEFTWAEDYKTATVKLTCKHDAKHVVEEACEVTEKPETATCETAGKALFTATATVDGQTYTDTKEAEVAALGHDYGEPVFTWNDDHSAASAVFICANDNKHTEKVKATVTSETTKEATCEEAGVVAYTATVEFDGTTYTDTKTEEIPAAGHQYGEPEFTWNDDNKATVKRTCTVDGTTETLDSEEVTYDTKTVAATCEKAGKTTYTATVKVGDQTYTDTKTVEIPAVGHQYGEPEFTWNDDNKATVKRTCTVDGTTETLDSKEVTYDTETVNATCEKAGKTTYTATVKVGDQTYTDTKTVEIPAGHDWSGEWKVVKKATKTEAGKRVKECANGCGQKKYEVIPATGSQEEPEDPNAGKLEKDAEVATDAPVQEVTMGNSKSELLSAGNIFTKKEKAAIAAGTDARVWLEISSTNMGNISKEEQTKINEKIATIPGVSKEHVTYFDADLFKQVGDAEKSQIREPGTAIKVTVKIPGNLLNTNKKINREYYIIRLHDGAAKVLNGTFDNTTGEFAFKTDKFSTYAIVYTDTEKKADDSNKPSGDDTNKPSGDNTNKPSDDSNKPSGDNTNKPSDDSSKPSGDNSNKPTADNNPLVEANKPSDNNNPTGNHTVNTALNPSDPSKEAKNVSSQDTGDHSGIEWFLALIPAGAFLYVAGRRRKKNEA